MEVAVEVDRHIWIITVTDHHHTGTETIGLVPDLDLPVQVGKDRDEAEENLKGMFQDLQLGKPHWQVTKENDIAHRQANLKVLLEKEERTKIIVIVVMVTRTKVINPQYLGVKKILAEESHQGVKISR